MLKKRAMSLSRTPFHVAASSVWSLVFLKAQLLGDADRNWNLGLRKFCHLTPVCCSFKHSLLPGVSSFESKQSKNDNSICAPLPVEQCLLIRVF